MKRGISFFFLVVFFAGLVFIAAFNLFFGEKKSLKKDEVLVHSIEDNKKNDGKGLGDNLHGKKVEKIAGQSRKLQFIQRIVNRISLWAMSKTRIFRSKPIVRVLSGPIFLKKDKEVRINFDPPLVKVRKDASIEIAIEEPFEVRPPWKDVLLKYHGPVQAKVCLMTERGVKICQDIIGESMGDSGSYLDFRFKPKLPLNEKFVTLSVQFGANVKVKEIRFYQYNYL